MIRLNVESDHHADFTGNKIERRHVDCDAHLWVGDGAGPLRLAIEIMAEALKDSSAIKVYVPGNHDFYHTMAFPQSYMQDELARGIEAGKAAGIHVLSNETLIVNDCRILGTTLFTDIMAGDPDLSPNQKKALSQKGYSGDERYGGGQREYHNDFREIRYGASGSKNRFTPSQWLQLHAEAMDWLRGELAKPWDGETVVATHMAPSTESLAPGFRNHDWLYATTDCVDLFEHVDLWAHGHIHSAKDYEIDGCMVIANPRGYPRREGGFENVDWKPALVVEVEPRCNRRMIP
jgi:hypothetical protein